MMPEAESAVLTFEPHNGKFRVLLPPDNSLITHHFQKGHL